MKRLYPAIVLSTSLILTALQAAEQKINAIKFVIDDLSKQPLWTNGLFIPLKLPQTATVDELVASYVKEANFKNGRPADYKIEESSVSPIPINSKEIYTIARISSDQGGKILIFRYDEGQWWTKNLDAAPYYLKATAE